MRIVEEAPCGVTDPLTESACDGAGPIRTAGRMGQALSELQGLCERAGFAPVGSFAKIDYALRTIEMLAVDIIASPDASNICDTVADCRRQWDELIHAEWYHDLVSTCCDETEGGDYDLPAMTVGLCVAPLRQLRNAIVEVLHESPMLLKTVLLAENAAALQLDLTDGGSQAQKGKRKKKGRPASDEIAERNAAMWAAKNTGLTWGEVGKQFGVKADAARVGAQSAHQKQLSEKKKTQEPRQPQLTGHMAEFMNSLVEDWK